MNCPICGNPMTSQEEAVYKDRCEDCFGVHTAHKYQHRDMKDRKEILKSKENPLSRGK